MSNTLFTNNQSINRYETPARIKPASPDQYTGNPTPSVFQGHYDFGNSFYSTVLGPATFIFLNSYTDTDADSIQYKWVQRTFENIDRSVTPWVFVVFHCPMYNSFDDHQVRGRSV